jgi:hypothetical protein
VEAVLYWWATQYTDDDNNIGDTFISTAHKENNCCILINSLESTIIRTISVCDINSYAFVQLFLLADL